MENWRKMIEQWINAQCEHKQKNKENNVHCCCWFEVNFEDY